MTSIWNVLKNLGNQSVRMLGGRFKEYHQRSGEGLANVSSRVDAAYILGGNYRQQLNANLNTDMILKSCTTMSERGWSGVCTVLSGASVLFKRADNSRQWCSFAAKHARHVCPEGPCGRDNNCKNNCDLQPTDDCHDNAPRIDGGLKSLGPQQRVDEIHTKADGYEQG